MGDDSGRDVVFHYLPLCFMGSRIVLWTSLWRETEMRLSTDLDHLVDELAVAAPHHLLNVPLVLERLRAGVEASIAGRSIVVGVLWSAARRAWARHVAGEPLGVLDRFVLQQAEQRIFSAIRARFGPNLRFLICGSAALRPETQQWFEMIGVPVYQVYGLTETTAIVTMDVAGDAAAGWVGFPVEGCEVRLGDGGELQIRGPNVFDGYWERPEATEAAFTNGWYRTGDRAELDDEGRVAILGRMKELLVPSTGHNVAPEPIEQRLVEAIPGAEQVVVVGHGRPYLSALVTGQAREADVRAGVEAVNKVLPHYQQVRRWRQVGPALTHEDGLITANGKLRRHEVEARFAADIQALYP
jgi:long-chain acyl-CoA synthetase